MNCQFKEKTKWQQYKMFQVTGNQNKIANSEISPHPYQIAQIRKLGSIKDYITCEIGTLLHD